MGISRAMVLAGVDSGSSMDEYLDNMIIA